jgi:hypothetical protein
LSGTHLIATPDSNRMWLHMEQPTDSSVDM